jgi:nitroreductase
MDLLEGIKTRKSIRAFKPKDIPEKVIVDVLETAIRAPSGVNLQPWEFLVVRGAILEELRRAYVDEYRLGKKPAPEIPVGDTKGGAPVLQGAFRERSVTLAKQIFELLHISKGDKKRQSDYMESMMRFWGAPVVILIVIDKILVGAWPILDTGFVAQNIALAAQDHRLGTCVMRAIVDYPEQLRRILNISESKRIIVGIAIGYPDWEHPINQLKTNRESISNIIRFVE